MANGKQEKRRVTDIIKPEDVLKWQPNNNVLISSPMGAGKSYFCEENFWKNTDVNTQVKLCGTV